MSHGALQELEIGSKPCRSTLRPGVSKIFDLENFWMEEKCFLTYLWFEKFFKVFHKIFKACRPTLRPGVSKIFDLENFWMEEKRFLTYLWFEKFFQSLQQDIQNPVAPRSGQAFQKLLT